MSKLYLIEENVLTISAFRSKLLKIPILTDAMLQTQLLPELTANYIVSVLRLRPRLRIFRALTYRCCHIGQPGLL